MAIQLVGQKRLASQVSTASTMTIDLTTISGGIGSAPATDDLVVVSVAQGDIADRTMALLTSGYTKVADVYGNATRDANLGVFVKKMGSTPDTQVQYSHPGAAGGKPRSVIMLVTVLRGVDPTTALDVAVQTGVIAGQWQPNPPAITPATSGAWVMAIAATSEDGGASFGAPSGWIYKNGQFGVSVNNPINIVSYILTTTTGGVSYDPPGPTDSSNEPNDSGSSNASVTLAFRPAPSTGGNLKVWNGASWVAKPVKVWSGANWVAKPVKVWSGAAWVTTTY